jgi:very-short-patch-repair endonuclease
MFYFQKPSDHLHGCGCPICAHENSGSYRKLSLEIFIERANKIHNYKYDYSRVIYINSRTKVEIICKVHGISFFQAPGDHLRGAGCARCSYDRKKSTTEKYIIKAEKVHSFIYNYSELVYIDSVTPVKIICKKCGNIFFQIPSNHLSGYGCPRCNFSHGELAVEEILKKHKVKYEVQKRFIECKSKNPLPFDFYIPEYNLLIEYDGEQHFKKISGKWENDLKSVKIRDRIKNKFCKEHGYNLLRIPYYCKDELKEIVESALIA